ncbi:MAG TPA: hypothetical protein DCY00_02590 [Actinobacteria bacterium]|nr:hypothetical protein [Actinomycetota bacterium]
MLAVTDTSFIYAVVDKNDQNHKKASGFLNDNADLAYVIPFSTMLQASRLIGSLISRQTEIVFMENIIKNFNIEMNEHDDIARAFHILEYCWNLGISEIDLDEALFISVCERLGSNNILTFRKKIYEKIMPSGFKVFNFLI